MQTFVNDKKFKRSSTSAYIGFLFSTCFRRPFSYIAVLLYLLYLATILLIVPGALHFSPLFIWSNAQFNMQIFNLFFCAIICAALAVAIFRTGREDGTDLTISSKPLKRSSIIFAKTITFLILMIAFSAICILIAVSTIGFGIYSESNPTGITMDQYKGLILSIFIGNIINMLIFGALAILISIVGGTVITMIGTIGIAFLLSALNFIYPRVVANPVNILENKYNSVIDSYSITTLNQYDSNCEDWTPNMYATIRCSDPTNVLDTSKYWNIANSESNLSAINYIDFGKQLSFLYSSFGLETTKLQSANKTAIGASSSYAYKILDGSSIKLPEVINLKQIPIFTYSLAKSQGQEFSIVNMLGNSMSSSALNNWNVVSTLFGVDFNSVNCVSITDSGLNLSTNITKDVPQPYRTINKLRLTETQKSAAYSALEQILNNFDPQISNYSTMANEAISHIQPGILWDETKQWDDLDVNEKYDIISKVQTYWLICSQNHQINSIHEYNPQAAFPYNNEVVTNWYANCVGSAAEPKEEYKIQKLIESIFNKNIYIGDILLEDGPTIKIYSHANTSTLTYSETLNNLYRYSVSEYMSIAPISIGWGCGAIILFAISIIIFKRIDLK